MAFLQYSLSHLALQKIAYRVGKIRLINILEIFDSGNHNLETLKFENFGIEQLFGIFPMCRAVLSLLSIKETNSGFCLTSAIKGHFFFFFFSLSNNIYTFFDIFGQFRTMTLHRRSCGKPHQQFKKNVVRSG